MKTLNIGPLFITKKQAKEFNETMENIPFTPVERLKKEAEEFEKNFYKDTSLPTQVNNGEEI